MDPGGRVRPPIYQASKNAGKQWVRVTLSEPWVPPPAQEPVHVVPAPGAKLKGDGGPTSSQRVFTFSVRSRYWGFSEAPGLTLAAREVS